jgi:cytochrome P450
VHVVDGWPLVGVFADFVKNPGEFCYQTMLGGLRRGKRVSRMDILSKKTWLITDPSDVETAFLNSEVMKRMWKGDGFTRSDVLFGNSLVLSDAEAWRQNRRILQPGFNSARFHDLTAQMTKIVAAGLEDWRARAAAGEPIDVGPEMMRFTLLIIMKLMFSMEPSAAELHETEEAFRAALKYVSLLMGTYAVPRRWQQRLFPSGAFRKALVFLDRLAERCIQAHRDHPEEYDDLLTMMLAARYEDGSPMTPKQIRDEVILVLFGGYEATADGMTSCLWMLSQHGEVEEKLRAAVLARLGSVAKGGRDPVFSDLYSRGADSTEIGYLSQTLDETTRLWPPFWSVLRGTQRDEIEIGDCRVPGNAEVVLCPYATHRHPEHWDRPLEFDPERFSPEKVKARRPGVYFPFALGQRKCIGEHIARIEMRMIIAMILQRFRFTVVKRPTLHVEATTRFRNLMMRIEALN